MPGWAGPGSVEIQESVYDHRPDNAGPSKIKLVVIPRKEGTFTVDTKWNGALVHTVQRSPVQCDAAWGWGVHTAQRVPQLQNCGGGWNH